MNLKLVHRNNLDRNFDVVDLLRGFIPCRLETFLTSNLSPPLNVKRLDQVLVDAQSYFINQFRSKVWSLRNIKLKDSQASFGITKKMLKKKFRDRDKSVSLQIDNSTTNNFDINSFFPPEINDLVSDYISYGSRMYDVY